MATNNGKHLWIVQWEAGIIINDSVLKYIADQFAKVGNSVSLKCSNRFRFKTVITITWKSMHAKFYLQKRHY